MSDNMNENPFAALFSSISDIEKFKSKDEPNNYSAEELAVNNYLEQTFLFTACYTSAVESSQPKIFLEDYQGSSKGKQLLSFEHLNQALFDRLMIEAPTSSMCNSKSDVIEESRILFYLYQCFYRAHVSSQKIWEEETQKEIVSQSAMFLCSPDIFPHNQNQDQLLDLLQTYHNENGHPDILGLFLERITDLIHERNQEDPGETLTVLQALSLSFDSFRQRLSKMSLVDRNLFVHLDLLQYFLKTPTLSGAVLDFSTPANLEDGRSYQETLLGAFLSASCLPKKTDGPYEYFQNPSQFSSGEHSITEQNLGKPLLFLANQLSQSFLKIFKQSEESKEKLLKWIGNCLNANSGRSKIWTNHYQETTESVNVSDGFALNLQAVLLQLCKPLSQPYSLKLLKIQPAYCKETSPSKSSLHIKNLPKETFLIVREDEDHLFYPDSYNFLTQLFFATHYSLHIGFNVVQEQLVKLSQDLSRTQRLYEDTMAQGGASPIGDQIKQGLERGLTKFLSIKTALLERETLVQMVHFHQATATLLINLAVSENQDMFIEPSFPLPEHVPLHLACIPEFIVENIKECVTTFIRHFGLKTLEISGPLLKHFMTLILVFMGSPERIKNPHLRANLAEMLEALIPPKENSSSVFSNDSLFVQHPLISNLVSTLLHVFVSIEMTGQSVAFEQKFQYRKPIYTVLEYLWTIDIHKKKMKELAKDAENKVDSSTPPLFLVFINLLMNDAIFLLDEALSYMSQLRELQIQRDAGAWTNLAPNQRHQNEANFQHMGLLARFHNVMGSETIKTLAWLTTEIKSIFCHPTLVDRMAAMLNYFLLHLVGPKKKNFRVKDLSVYDFKPQELVGDICHLYLNLAEGCIDGYSGPKTAKSLDFCSAVCKDGRSYSLELFVQAQAVLLKIGLKTMAEKLQNVSAVVADLADKLQKDEATLGEIPEEFLDPIMSTLMSDPVILPSSGICIDRATISRHLLSDQTDPFNRTPLSMEMVKPNPELKEQIDKWQKQQRTPL